MEAPARRWRAAGWAVALALAGSALVGRLPETDNSVDSLLGAGSSSASAYRAFRARFGADELTLVSISGDSLPHVIDHARRVHAMFEQHDALRLVVTASTAFGSALDALSDPALAGPSARKPLQGPLNRELGLLSFDPPRARLLGASEPGAPPRGLLEDLEAARRAAEADGLELHTAGTAVLNAAIDRASERIETRALPAVIGLASVLLLVAVRRLRAVAFLLGSVGLVVFGVDSAFGALGGTSNVLVVIHRPIAFVLMLASGVHLIEAWRTAEGASPHDAARTKGRAIRLALGTTAAGFASLAVSPLPPIRDFGILTAICLLVSVPIVLGFMPVLLRWARSPNAESHPWTQRLPVGFARFGARHRGPMIAGAFALLALGGAAGMQVPIDTHAIHYFDEDTRVRRDHESIEASGLGLQSLEVMLSVDPPFEPEPDRVRRLDAFAAAVREEDGVTARFDPALLLLEAGYRVSGRAIPPDPLTRDRMWTKSSPGVKATLADDGRVVRVALLIETMDAKELDALEARIERLASQHLGLPAERVTVTGNYRLLLDAQRSLLRTLAWSLAITAVVMQIVLAFALGSVRIGVAAMLPNLLPVAATFLVMTITGTPLDLGTSMVASLALAIAVDDTLHFTLAHSTRDPEAAARRSGRAILLTSWIMGLGFAVLVPSTFRPASAFGLLSATALATAVVGDLLVLPALLSLGFLRSRHPA